ncbi:hypothetical protein JCGZ_02893 [Jatropha curcas]|uniref:Uncharacterized protein n=1 Tax=Jatropha curcas TaxID=180498 RepID=A0A067L4M0_JATCU|nr:uncharacterized protein LOC110009090 [Jatropha curcas]KDP42163.1 hypothetical protein JCGZ_02893 [Jatropha curcas]
MAKVAIFVLALALVLFVSTHSVVSEESSNPSIYEQIDKAAEEVKGVVHEAKATDSNEKKEETTASPETAKKNQGDGSSATWGTWFKNKLGGIEELISGNSQQKPSSAGGPAQAPSPNAGSAKAPSTKSN